MEMRVISTANSWTMDMKSEGVTLESLSTSTLSTVTPRLLYWDA